MQRVPRALVPSVPTDCAQSVSESQNSEAENLSAAPADLGPVVLTVQSTAPLLNPTSTRSRQIECSCITTKGCNKIIIGSLQTEEDFVSSLIVN